MISFEKMDDILVFKIENQNKYKVKWYGLNVLIIFIKSEEAYSCCGWPDFNLKTLSNRECPVCRFSIEG